MVSANRYSRGPEDTGIVISGRVKASDGSYAQQADVTAITRVVYDKNADQVIFTDSLTVSSVIFDSLQTGGPWDTSIDAAGYTFKDAIPGTRFPSANADQGEKMQTYIVEYQFDMEDGFDFSARAAHHNTDQVYGS